MNTFLKITEIIKNIGLLAAIGFLCWFIYLILTSDKTAEEAINEIAAKIGGGNVIISDKIGKAAKIIKDKFTGGTAGTYTIYGGVEQNQFGG